MQIFLIGVKMPGSKIRNIIVKYFRKLIKIISIIIRFRYADIILKKPKYVDILIYDRNFPKELQVLVSKYNYSYLPTRGESINLYILLKVLLNPKLWEGNLFKSYIFYYIHVVSPRIVLTYIDNDPNFYTISGRFERIKTIFIQNGVRKSTNDIFNVLVKDKKLHVDYMLVHNLDIGKKFNEFISGEVIPIGSFLNNSFIEEKISISNRIVFVSSFKTSNISKSVSLSNHSKVDNHLCRYLDNYEYILRLLKSWCQANNKDLYILGKYADQKIVEMERIWLSEILEDFPYTYTPKRNKYQSYSLISTANIVVSLGSTLGFEALARNKKVALFLDYNDKNMTPFEFNFSALSRNEGAFWTGTRHDHRFLFIMNFLNSVSDNNWQEILNTEFGDSIMKYDPNNLKFINLLHRLLL
jgi:surface carbohydrate biosynthesis protein